MRPFLLSAAVILAACAITPASAQRLGQRTVSAEAMAAQLERGHPEEEIRALVAAAEAHPLGSVENPIRVGGPNGERAYLARLRCADGQAPRIGSRSEGGTGGFGSVVGTYPVDCAGHRTTLSFDIYHEEHEENRAPAGFNILR